MTDQTEAPATASAIVTRPSPWSVADTVSRF